MRDTNKHIVLSAMMLLLCRKKILSPVECTTIPKVNLISVNTVCTPVDSDACLRSSSGWRGYSCSNSIKYCDSWSKDVRRCCPESCNNTIAFTETVCKESKGRGICKYPNNAQCPEGN